MDTQRIPWARHAGRCMPSMRRSQARGRAGSQTPRSPAVRRFASSSFALVSVMLVSAVIAFLTASSLALAETGSSTSRITPVECAEIARDRTLLDLREAQELCRGAASLGPLTCFEQALDGELLDPPQAITLCRCAESLEPLRCFEKARELEPSDTTGAIRECSEIVLRDLSSDCRPVVPVEPILPGPRGSE